VSKQKTLFVCNNCGAESPKWVGRCSSCNQWNTFTEETVSVKSISQKSSTFTKSKPIKIEEIPAHKMSRIPSLNNEFDRVLGGGIVPGSLILLGGEPGIGKSTLLLQVALGLNRKVLYVSGEESEQQIKLRAERLKIANQDCLIYSETNIDEIITNVVNIKPELVIIDSIQTVQNLSVEAIPGSISQIRECAFQLLKFSKESHIPFVLVGHINKEGSLAGPKILEHMVDVVLQFEGDLNYVFRIVRSIKNRFGSTSELGIYEMQESGLKEINNASEYLISKADENLSGVSISATAEGIRPLLIEVQALVSTAAYGTPQRTSNGFDTKKLNMLLAVLEKRAGFKLLQKDVFLNIAGGIKVSDPAIDLSVIISIISSNFDIPVEASVCFTGEVGLTGEIRPVQKIEKRIIEAEKIGFKKIYIPLQNLSSVNTKKRSIEVIAVSRIENVLQQVFKQR